ncbi:enoyl-CoA hydratase [Reticulomyxa filosa]|uniref:Enoyl-CoA hydratase n=1 Tax=Reticulomyxa filosa TaxID=46433 RepID=X6MZA8_RETFI|nr:enoyl-CoA hydratase [Reticulomyxa filosa]|eukprot:ETO19166.1 enoyl-CoA hydratase [Reticulomyxa filosa]
MNPVFSFVEFQKCYEHRLARIILNRPEHYNAITFGMGREIKQAVVLANADEGISVIVIEGKGKYFCSGYDLKTGVTNEVARQSDNSIENPCSQKLPWDPSKDYAAMGNNEITEGFTSCFMSLFKSRKPTIACVHGGCIGGGTDIALCCDLIFMTKDAKIGYPPVRLWGVPTTAMWTLHLGPQKAKYLLFTGDLIDGSTAEQMGLIAKALPNETELKDFVFKVAKRISSVPSNQLFFNKLVINNICNAMYGGIDNVQSLASILDGASRHTPEGIMFAKFAQQQGFKNAIKFRDSGQDLNLDKNSSFKLELNSDDIKPQLRSKM